MGSRSIHTARYRQFAGMLRAWRIGAGLSQRDLAARLRKPPSYVHKCEVAERKLDPLELLDWWNECDLDPLKTLRELAAADKKRR